MQQEKKRYTAEEVLNLQSAAYQKGYNEGYQLRKQEHPGTAIWVKAHKGLIPDGIYNMKLISRDSVEMRGTGLVTNNAITLITFLNKSTMGESELPENYEGVYYLDETGQSNKDDAVDWVDVNDRLPYKDGDSSVYCLVNDTYEGIVVRPFNEVHVCWDQEDGDDYYTSAKGGKITHWKPLPEPPKKRQK